MKLAGGLNFVISPFYPATLYLAFDFKPLTLIYWEVRFMIILISFGMVTQIKVYSLF